MKCVIIANGNILNYNFYTDIISKADYIICADGGAKHLLKMNKLPDAIIGDLDSIDEEARSFFEERKVKFYKFPPNKDATDTEIAVDFAISHNPSEVILLGAIGSRMDHSIANITLLKKLLDKGIRGKLINESNEIYLLNDINNELVISGEKGDYLSLIPLGDKVKGINLKGFKYPLIDAEVPLGSSLGISNELISGKTGRIKIEEGTVLVVKARD